MEGDPGGETVFTQTLKSLPAIKMPAIVESLAGKYGLSNPQSIPSAFLKLIILHKATTMQQIIEAAASIGEEGCYANRVVLLYALALLVLPLRESFKNREESLQPIKYTFFPILPKQHGQCITFEYRFSSRNGLSESECILGAWRMMAEQLEKYDVSCREREDGRVTEIAYNHPLFAGLPSAFRLFPQNTYLSLVFSYQKYMHGIELRTYLNLARHKRKFVFMTFLENLAVALGKYIKMLSSNGHSFIEMALEIIYVVEQSELSIQIDSPYISQQPEGQRFSIEFDGTALLTLKRNAGAVLLKTIAIWFNRNNLERDLQERRESQVDESLLRFIEEIKEERLLLEKGLLQKIEKWLKLEQDEDQLYLEKENEARESISSMSPPQAAYHYQLSIPHEKGLNINEELQLLERYQRQGKLKHLVAQKLSEQERSKLEEQILGSYSFFRENKFEIESSSVFFSPCAACKLQSKIVFFNLCGHGKCLNCFSDYIKEAVQRKEVHIVCKVQKCPKQLSYQLIRSIIQKNAIEGLKRSYCQLLIPLYLQNKNKNKKYVRCCQSECDNLPVVYKRYEQSRILICQSCKMAICIQCGKSCHFPKTCLEFNKEEKAALKEVESKFLQIKWPKFMQKEKSAKKREEKLRQAGMLSMSLQEITLMVKDWLTLITCQGTQMRSRKLGLRSDFLRLLSQRISQLLRKIDSHYQAGTLTLQHFDCLNCCIQLQRIHSLRQSIIATEYYQ